MAKGAVRSGNSSDNPNRKAKGGMRSKTTINRLHMYNSGKAQRDKKGKIIGGFLRSINKTANQDMAKAARIQPDRRWFGNTRVLSQTELDKFRDAMTTATSNPYSVVLRSKTLPMSLLQDTKKAASMNLLTTESFQDTFGPNKKRKRPKIQITSLEHLSENVIKRSDEYTARGKDSNIVEDENSTVRDEVKDKIFSKGQSRRIWEELYKVLDSSDVIIQVIDARDPMGTRSRHVENYLKGNCKNKHMILIINKCDLVPTWCIKKWIKILSKDFPTLAFHANINNSFGKGNLIQLLRQYAMLHSDKQQISVGFIGYPNVGKSSIINTLRKEKVCKVAPIPGETKVWQYITLMKNIYLIDCPGIVYPDDHENTESDIVLKGIVRAERLESPEDYIDDVLNRINREYIFNTYGIAAYKDGTDFLTQYAIKCGKLLKGGDPDLRQAAIMVINDWQRGKIPYYTPPPKTEEEIKEEEEKRNKKIEEENDENVDENDIEKEVEDEIKNLKESGKMEIDKVEEEEEEQQQLEEEDNNTNKKKKKNVNKKNKKIKKPKSNKKKV